jgi:hypothetical protein
MLNVTTVAPMVNSSEATIKPRRVVSFRISARTSLGKNGSLVEIATVLMLLLLVVK